MYSQFRHVCSSRVSLAVFALGLLLAAAVPASADYPDDDLRYGDQYEDSYGDGAGYEGSYSYVRSLEGSATLIQGDSGDRDTLQVNQPVLVGDRIWVAPRGRVEVVLSDRNLLRIDGSSEVVFEALAGSPDRQDRNSVLRLPQGNVQLVVVSDFLGEGVPRVDTANATVYPRDLGSYRITADGSDWSEVVAREGSAEVVTREGSLLVRTGEEAVVEGGNRPRQQVRTAGRLDNLELWGQRLDREAQYAATPYLDDSLRYEAATLDRHGTWVRVDTRYAWRPRVGVDWRPYHDGRWRFTDLGLTWVSYEPWGWAPYHYGSWDYLPGHGWVWFPGYRFSPAWVYWYWTDHYAGWVPVGYYTRHYRPYYGGHFGFRFGVYGWAGGHWGHYDRWTFCDTRYIGYRDQHRYSRRGDHFGREHRYAVPRRGVLTTDTRGLSRTAVQRAQGIEEVLVARRGRELPDVTDFVARRRDLSDDVRGRVLVDTRGSRSADRSPDRAQVLSVDGIPGASSARRVRDAGGEGIERRFPERVAVGRDGVRGSGAAPTPSVVERKPAVRPGTSDGRERPDERFRARPEVDSVDRTLPRERTPETARPELERQIERPSRVETRPAPAPTGRDDWRRPAVDLRRPPTRQVPERSAPPRVESARPLDRSDRDAGADWRERPSVRPSRLPERSVDRPEARQIEPQGSDWRRSGEASGRYSLPRRVIEGVRSNGQGSTPFRPDPRQERSERVETRPDYRPSSPPPRVESRPEPSRPSPPPRMQSRPSSSRPSSPPSRMESRSSRPPSRASSPRSSHSSRSSEGRSPARRRPPTD